MYVATLAVLSQIAKFLVKMLESNKLPPFRINGHTMTNDICDYYQENVANVPHPGKNHSTIGFFASSVPPFSITTRTSLGNSTYRMVCGSLYRMTLEVARRMNAGFVKYDNIDPSCLCSSFVLVCR